LRVKRVFLKGCSIFLVEEDDEFDDGLDPRDELVKKLLEYQSFKEAAKELGMLAKERRMIYTRQISEHYVPDISIDPGEAVFSTDLYELIQAFSKILREKSKEVIHEVYGEAVSIEQKIEEIKHIISIAEKVYFRDLFEKSSSKNELIATFIAILELAKQKVVSIVQPKNFDDILLQKVTNG